MVLFFATMDLLFSEIYVVPEIIDSGPMCIIDLFQNKSVEYFNP